MCPICNAGSVGVKWIRDYYQGNRIGIEDIANHFGMSIQEVHDHINNHELLVVHEVDQHNRTRELTSPDFILNELSTLYSAVYDCFQDIRGNETDGVKIDQITRLTKELRETIKQITDYQGKTGHKSERETKIINIEGNFNMLIDVISGGTLCPHCQSKVLKKLDDPEISKLLK